MHLKIRQSQVHLPNYISPPTHSCLSLLPLLLPGTKHCIHPRQYKWDHDWACWLFAFPGQSCLLQFLFVAPPLMVLTGNHNNCYPGSRRKCEELYNQLRLLVREEQFDSSDQDRLLPDSWKNLPLLILFRVKYAPLIWRPLLLSYNNLPHSYVPFARDHPFHYQDSSILYYRAPDNHVSFATQHNKDRPLHCNIPPIALLLQSFRFPCSL